MSGYGDAEKLAAARSLSQSYSSKSKSNKCEKYGGGGGGGGGYHPPQNRDHYPPQNRSHCPPQNSGHYTPEYRGSYDKKRTTFPPNIPPPSMRRYENALIPNAEEYAGGPLLGHSIKDFLTRRTPTTPCDENAASKSTGEQVTTCSTMAKNVQAEDLNVKKTTSMHSLFSFQSKSSMDEDYD